MPLTDLPLEGRLFVDMVLFGRAPFSENEVSASDSDDESSRARRGKSRALYCKVVLLDAADEWKFVLPFIGVIRGFLFVLLNEIGAATMIEGTSAFSRDSRKEYSNMSKFCCKTLDGIKPKEHLKTCYTG